MQTVEFRTLLGNKFDEVVDLAMNTAVCGLEDELRERIDCDYITPTQFTNLTEQFAHEVALRILQTHAKGQTTY